MTTTPAPSKASQRRLSGKLGPTAIVFMVVAAAAPLAVVGGVLPVGAITGNGAGMPAAFLLDGVILLLFAVGLSTMNQYVAKPGAFFTYVGHGLGRPAGVAAAWLALLTYTAMQIAVYAFLGLTLSLWVEDHLGLDMAWWAWTLACVGLVGVLGYRAVQLSGQVLGVVLVLEVAIVLVLVAVIVGQGGADGLSAESFTPAEFMSGSPGIALMWAIAGYAGFEATAIYRDEARDPDRTIPRATYGALVLIAVFYTVASWALIQGWGAGFDDAVGDTSASFVVVTAERYLGAASAEIINALLVTSFFACALSFHNVTTRYVHAMANAGLLPATLGEVNRRHGSPHTSSVALTSLVTAVLAASALAGLDPYLEVYTWLGGLGSVAIVMLMALTCIAVITYLRRPNVTAGPWRSWIAPGIGLLGLLFIGILLVQNLPMLVGDVDAAGNPRVGGLSTAFYAVLVLVPALGVVQAWWLRRTRPEVYGDVIDVISE